MLLKLVMAGSLLPKIVAVVCGIFAVCAVIVVCRNNRTSRREVVRPALPEADMAQKRRALKQALEQTQVNTGCRPYALLFNRFALPLQILLGVAAESADSGWLNAERARYILEEDVVGAMTAALRHQKATVKNGSIILPVDVDTEAVYSDAYLEQLSAAELDRRLRIALKEQSASRIFLARKTLIEELGGVYTQLLALLQEPGYPSEQVRAAAARTAQLLERGGIYPLFRGSEALDGCPDAFFEAVSDQQLVYPGLFIQEDSGTLRLMGTHYGTWRNS